MNEQLKLLLDSIGGLAEMSGLMRDEMMRNGFTRREAVSLVQTFIKTIFQPKENKEEN